MNASDAQRARELAAANAAAARSAVAFLATYCARSGARRTNVN